MFKPFHKGGGKPPHKASGHKPPKKGGSSALDGLKKAGPKAPPQDGGGPPQVGPSAPPNLGNAVKDKLKKPQANPLQGLQAALKEAQTQKLAQQVAAAGFGGF